MSNLDIATEIVYWNAPLLSAPQEEQTIGDALGRYTKLIVAISDQLDHGGKTKCCCSQ